MSVVMFVSRKDPFAVVLVRTSGLTFEPGHPRTYPADVIDTARLVHGGSTTQARKELHSLAEEDPAGYGALKGVGDSNVDYVKGILYSGAEPLFRVTATAGDPENPTQPRRITFQGSGDVTLSSSMLSYCHLHEIRIQPGPNGPEIV
jgi:hypothetical protein